MKDFLNQYGTALGTILTSAIAWAATAAGTAMNEAAVLTLVGSVAAFLLKFLAKKA